MIPAESAHDTIGALGEVGLLQFKDLNADKSAFQRTYANQVRPGRLSGAAGTRFRAWLRGRNAKATGEGQITHLSLAVLLLCR